MKYVSHFEMYRSLKKEDVAAKMLRKCYLATEILLSSYVVLTLVLETTSHTYLLVSKFDWISYFPHKCNFIFCC